MSEIDEIMQEWDLPTVELRERVEAEVFARARDNLTGMDEEQRDWEEGEES